MSFKVDQINNGSIVYIAGEIDLSISGEMKDIILEQINLNQKEHSFNLSKCSERKKEEFLAPAPPTANSLNTNICSQGNLNTASLALLSTKE